MVTISSTFVRDRTVVLFLLIVFVLGGVLAFFPSKDRPQRSSEIILGEHHYPVHCVAFAPDGRTVAAGGGVPKLEGEVRLWDVATGRTQSILRGHRDRVYAAAYAPDGQTLATVSVDEVVMLWDVATGQERARIPLLPMPCSLHGAFSPAGQALALTGWEPGVVGLWRRPSAPKNAMTAASGPVAFADGGRRLVLWRTGPRPELGGERLDGQPLTAAGKDENWPTVEIWDVSIGQQAFTLRGHDNHVWGLAFSPNGKLLASVSSDQTVRLWDVATGRVRSILRGHTDQVSGVAFSPDNRLLASASHDRTVRIWDVSTGWQQAVFRGHVGAVTCVAFAPSGQWVASGSYDKTLRIWPLTKFP